MEDRSVASSPGSAPYVPEEDTLTSIENIPSLQLDPPTDTDDSVDSGHATDIEGTTQVDFYPDIENDVDVDLEKGYPPRPSLDDGLNYDGHDISVCGAKHDFLCLPPIKQERTNTSLEGSVQEFFEGHDRAKAAMDYEQGLTLSYTIRHFLPALFWALCMGALTITDGYESTMISALLSYQPFCRRYGIIHAPEDWTRPIPPGSDVDEDGTWDSHLRLIWSIAINVAPCIGVLAGLASAARLVNRFGYRFCAMLSLVMACIFLSVPLISTIQFGHEKKDLSLTIFMVGEMLLGIPWGLLSGIVTSYVSDITPLKLRVFATTMINIFWLIGQSTAFLALQGFGRLGLDGDDLLLISEDHDDYPAALERKDAWAFRGPMLMQFLWIVPLLVIIRRAPDSPLYWVRSGNDKEALKCLRNLNRDPSYNPVTALEAIKIVNEREKGDSENAGLLECFTKKNIRRTEIAAMAMVTSQLVGTQLLFYSLRLLQSSGLSQSLALWCSLGICLVCMSANFGSVFAMKRYGRRTIWIWGLSAIIICLAIIGACGFVYAEVQCGGTEDTITKDDEYGETSSDNCSSANLLCWVVACVTIIFGFIYNFTIGPISFTVVAETPSSRLKTATNGAARGSFMVVSLVNASLLQYLLGEKPEGAGFGSRVGVMYTVTASLCLVWAWYRLPEMKDRTPAEIDILFGQNVPRREWADKKLD